MTTINAARAAELCGITKQGMIHAIFTGRLPAVALKSKSGATRYELKLADVVAFARERMQTASTEFALTVEAFDRAQAALKTAA